MDFSFCFGENGNVFLKFEKKTEIFFQVRRRVINF